MVVPTGLEPVTNRLWAGCSNQLSYRTRWHFTIWWLRWESNSWPPGYEPDALTNWATEPWWRGWESNPLPPACKAGALAKWATPPWWRRQDLNLRQLRPKRRALPSWATSPFMYYMCLIILSYEKYVL